jgi:hypothetical protein
VRVVTKVGGVTAALDDRLMSMGCPTIKLGLGLW